MDAFALPSRNPTLDSAEDEPACSLRNDLPASRNHQRGYSYRSESACLIRSPQDARRTVANCDNEYSNQLHESDNRRQANDRFDGTNLELGGGSAAEEAIELRTQRSVVSVFDTEPGREYRIN